MKILIAHNVYQQRGGEDVVFESETRLMREHGHNVTLMVEDNKDVNTTLRKVITALGTPFSINNYWKMRSNLRKDKVDLLHVHNFFPQYSPSIFYAAQSMGVPTILTLHNFRTICPTATLMHNGKVDERSIMNGPLWSIRDRVYRNSYTGTAAVAAMVQLNKKIGTWRNKVSAFIALSEFMREKFIEAGFPAEKIHVKSNFVWDPFGPEYRRESIGDYVLYVGRLSSEKGIHTLLNAWSGLSIPLVIAGKGPLEREVTDYSKNQNITYVGYKSPIQITELMRKARFLVVPSVCQEAFGMVVIEAFAAGLPVVASRVGSLAKIVRDGSTGLLAAPACPEDLARICGELFESRHRLELMASAARKEYLSKYTPEANYRVLIDIYAKAIQSDIV